MKETKSQDKRKAPGANEPGSGQPVCEICGSRSLLRYENILVCLECGKKYALSLWEGGSGADVQTGAEKKA